MSRTEDIKDLKLYTLREIEPIIGVTHRTLQTYIYEGKLKANKVGGRWTVTKEQLDDFIKGGK